MARNYKVIQQTGDRKGRRLFEGNEKDSRDFVERNYPRPHVDEFTADPDRPVHDVKLVSPEGVEEVYHSHEGWVSKPDYDAVPDEDESEELVTVRRSR